VSYNKQEKRDYILKLKEESSKKKPEKKSKAQKEVPKEETTE
tara:strand:- start:12939 stop:13064 length:126 start_codon:yes stop_codon:yes gene_type:complete